MKKFFIFKPRITQIKRIFWGHRLTQISARLYKPLNSLKNLKLEIPSVPLCLCAFVPLFLLTLFLTSAAYADYWAKSYGGTGNDYGANSIQQTSDGGYIVAGYTKSFGAGNWDFWVMKLNSDGTVSWQKTYGGTSGDLK